MRSEFCQRLFEARKSATLTQSQLSKDVGMTQGNYAELERAGQGSSFTPAIADRCGVSVNWLAYGKGKSGEPDTTLEDVFADRLKLSGIALVGRLSSALEANALSNSQIQLLARLIEEFSAN